MPKRAPREKSRFPTQIVFPKDILSKDDGHAQFILFNINKVAGGQFSSKGQRVENEIQSPYKKPVALSGGSSSVRATSKVLGGGFTRTLDSVVLQMPTGIATNYGVEWGTEELGKTGEVLNMSGDLADASWDTWKKVAKETFVDIGIKVLDLLPGINAEAAAAVARSKIKNPFSEVVFKGVANREFTFEFNLFARNEKDTKDIQEVIRRFKYHAHPEYSKGLSSTSYYVFPSTFDITFMYSPDGVDGKRNPFLPRISTCVLTGIAIDYGGEGGYAALSNGAPVDVKMTLTFTEIEQLHKGRFKEGEVF